MLKLDKVLRIAAGLAVALTTIFWSVAPIRAAGCSFSVLPFYEIGLFVPGDAIPTSDCEHTPFTETRSGIFGLESGAGFAIAGLGTLGAKATESSPSFGFGTNVIARFADTFSTDLATISMGSHLQFTLSLDGTFAVSGRSSAFIHATLDGNDNASETIARVELTSPGTAMLQLPLVPGLNDILLVGQLTADARGAFGTATSDFSTTFGITAIQLFDADGKFISDVTLTDAGGNSLPVRSSLATPEPASLALLATGILPFIRSTSRRFKRQRRQKERTASASHI